MLIPSGKQKKSRAESAPEPPQGGIVGGSGPQQEATRAKGEAASAAAPARASRPVTPGELIGPHRDAPLVPIGEASGKEVRWTLRHPDLDGSGYTGSVYLTKLDRWLSAELGYVTVRKQEERDALTAMGWILWRTEVPDAQPRVSRSF